MRVFGCGLALVIEFVTLVWVIKGSRHRFTIRILLMLILANLALFANETMNINMLKMTIALTRNLKSTTALNQSGCYCSTLLTEYVLKSILKWLDKYPSNLLNEKCQKTLLYAIKSQTWFF